MSAENNLTAKLINIPKPPSKMGMYIGIGVAVVVVIILVIVLSVVLTRRGKRNQYTGVAVPTTPAVAVPETPAVPVTPVVAPVSTAPVIVISTPISGVEYYNFDIINKQCYYLPKIDASVGTIQDVINATDYLEYDKKTCDAFTTNLPIYYADFNEKSVMGSPPTEPKNLYNEKVDSNGYLIGILNSQGEDLSQKIIDMIYNIPYPAPPPTQTDLNEINRQIAFDEKTQKLTVTPPIPSGFKWTLKSNTIEIRPGEIPVPLYITMCASLMRLNQKPKPTYKYENFKPVTLNEMKNKAIKKAVANISQLSLSMKFVDIPNPFPEQIQGIAKTEAPREPPLAPTPVCPPGQVMSGTGICESK